jgi:WXG100 family type VII secretion target
MADQTATDKGVMEKAAKDFEGVNDQLMSTLSTVKQKVAALQGGWVGRGGTSFQNTMEQWSERQNEINRLLKETADLIRSAGQSYTQTDENQANRHQIGDPRYAL